MEDRLRARFPGAAEATIIDLAANAATRNYAKGERLFSDKEAVSAIFIVVSGLASIYKLSASGEKKIIFIAGPDEILNESFEDELTASATCEAAEKLTVLCFNKKKFRELMRADFELARAVLASLSIKVRRLYRHLKNTTGSVRGDRRIAAKLWKLSRDYGVPVAAGVKIDLKLSVTSLADMLGAKRETVSRQLKTLGELELISTGGGYFVVTDRDRLADYFKKGEQ